MNTYSTYHTWSYRTYMITFVGQAQTEIFSIFLCSANNRWILVVQYVHDYVCLPSSKLLLVSIQCPTCAHDLPSMDPNKLYLCYYMSYICMSFTFVCPKRQCQRLSYFSCIPNLIRRKWRNSVEYRYLSMDALQSMNNRYRAYHTLIGCRM